MCSEPPGQLVEKRFLGSTKNKNKAKQQQKPKAGSSLCLVSANCEQQRHLVVMTGRDFAAPTASLTTPGCCWTVQCYCSVNREAPGLARSLRRDIYSRDREAQCWKFSGLFPTTYNHFYESVPLNNHQRGCPFSSAPSN